MHPAPRLDDPIKLASLKNNLKFSVQLVTNRSIYTACIVTEPAVLKCFGLRTGERVQLAIPRTESQLFQERQGIRLRA